MKGTVLITFPLHPAAQKLFEEGTNVRVLITDSLDEIVANIKGVNAIICSSAPPMDDYIAQRAPELLAVARHGVGYDNVNVPALTKHGICSLYTPMPLRKPVAEHALGLLLAVAKAFRPSMESMAAGGFSSGNDLPIVQLAGRTVGIIGCGRIGSRMAELCRALDMKVLAYDPYITKEKAAASGAELRPTLDEVLAESDVITLHTPLNAETRHMIGAAQLAKMKPTAYLINTARGPVVDEQALIAALRNKTILGAGLDVFEQEPCAADNPLRTMPNVVVTPHRAGASLECTEAIGKTLYKDITALFRGEKPEFLIDPSVWEKRRRLP